jgi:hypothetical protein
MPFEDPSEGPSEVPFDRLGRGVDLEFGESWMALEVGGKEVRSLVGVVSVCCDSNPFESCVPYTYSP